MNARMNRGHEALQNADLIVTKIGGENACEFQENFARISADTRRQIIAISALRSKTFSTTNLLIQMTKKAEAGDGTALDLLEALKAFHLRVIKEKVEEIYQGALISCIEVEFLNFQTLLAEILNKESGVEALGEDLLYKTEDGEIHSMIGFGEQLVERLYNIYFELKGSHVTTLKDSDWMDSVLGGNAAEAMRKQKSTLAKLRRAFKKSIQDALSGEGTIMLTGGYKPGVAFKRGYTDLTAAELARAGSALDKRTILGVEKADPILSADPRKITKPDALTVIEEMTWNMGAELFGIKGAQAGAVHPDVMETLRGTGVDIVVYDPRDIANRSTFISESLARDVDKTTVIASKNIPSTIIIRGFMSSAKGVLASISRSLRNFVLDQTYSSENIWAVTVNEEVPPDVLNKLERTLKRKYGGSFSVEVRSDLALVLAIGGYGANGYSDALKKAGVHTHFKNGVAEAQSSGYIIAATDVQIAVNTIHQHAHSK